MRPARSQYDRLCLQGILYVLYSDVSRQLLALELGFGFGQTCWCRLGLWREAGVFDRLHRLFLAELDWSRACVDASHIRTKKGGAKQLARGCLLGLVQLSPASMVR